MAALLIIVLVYTQRIDPQVSAALGAQHAKCAKQILTHRDEGFIEPDFETGRIGLPPGVGEGLVERPVVQGSSDEEALDSVVEGMGCGEELENANLTCITVQRTVAANFFRHYETYFFVLG
jgi:hypothetical protein